MGFYENFVRQCNRVGKTPSKVAQEIQISKSIVSRWKYGGGVTDATAMKIAEYFGVSIDELTGKSDLGDMLYEAARDKGLVESPFKKEKPTVTEDDGLSDRMKASQQKLIEIAKKLPAEEVELLLRQAELLIQMMESMNGDSQK